MANAAHVLWQEPRVPDAPARVRRDWVLVGAVVVATIVENLVRDIPWRPVTLAVSVVAVVALLIRRTHPLGAILLGFGTGLLLSVATFVAGLTEPVSTASMAFFLVLPYSLCRWGSGRDIVAGTVVTWAAAGIGFARDGTIWSEALIGLLFLTLPAVLGVAVRYGVVSRRRELEQARLREREQLARELHDTVAHHVSAMVVRAQAGRVVGAANHEAALDALAVIEQEGASTLREMRTIVGVLRRGEDPQLAPMHGVDDIRRLADDSTGRLSVAVTLDPGLEALPPATLSSLYRLAQESVTNAHRHARGGTRIEVRITLSASEIHLRVRDDGEPVPVGRAIPGYGLTGMGERVAMLGGTMRTGPLEQGGWEVDVTLPRRDTGR